jgi:hypothetical protein
MPGIERLPMWLRVSLYWVIFTTAITLVTCAVAGARFTLGRLLFIAAINGAVIAAERLATGRLPA